MKTTGERTVKDKLTAKDTTYDHVLKYTGVFGGVQGIKILISVVRNKLAALLLGPVGLGISAIYQNLTEIISNSTNFGISFSAIRTTSEVFEEGSESDMRHMVCVIRTWSVLSGLLAALVCAFCVVPFMHGVAFLYEGLHNTLLSLFGLNIGELDIPVDYWVEHRNVLYVLAVLVFSVAIEAGECALLKGMRKLKRMALVETLCTIATLVCTIPFYYILGLKGIAIGLTLTNVAIAIIHLCITTRIVAYRINPFSLKTIREGLPLIRIGVPYVLASVAMAFTTAILFHCLDDESQVGLYKAGFGLMVSYAGMVFVAVEADYFPRLSSVNHDTKRLNATINQQIDVCLLLMTPLLIAFILTMPWILRVLYSKEFDAVLPMAVTSVFYMFFRCVTIPIAYTALAKGDTLLYLFMEVVYDVAMIILFRYGHEQWGLLGVGCALSATSLFDLLWVGSMYAWRYKFRMARRTAMLCAAEMLCISVVLVFCLLNGYTIIKWSIGIVAISVSLYLAYRLLSSESDFIKKLRHKLTHTSSCNC